MTRLEITHLVPASAIPEATRNSVLHEFAAAATGRSSTGGSGPNTTPLNEPLQSVATQLNELASATGTVSQSQKDLQAAIAANTLAVIEASSNKQSLASQAGDVGKSFLSNIIGSSLIGTILTDIFGGGGTPTPPPLQKFTMPFSVTQNDGIKSGPGGGVVPVDFSAGGAARAQATRQSAPTAPTTNFTMNVNALDSQSFLDHADQIASAVQAAMNQSHSINDTIADL